ncbi:hypothetical protein [Cryobacterium sp. Y57]|uniref:hypothetical protein n=1 Tax=Cryobacterium sp. Y57 TaxID=2048287 RepID=UPI000CE4D5DB|nr:hypothetical protein [Cryobacterium sp. Y57]
MLGGLEAWKGDAFTDLSAPELCFLVEVALLVTDSECFAIPICLTLREGKNHGAVTIWVSQSDTAVLKYQNPRDRRCLTPRARRLKRDY